MRKIFAVLAFFAVSVAFGADARYSLTEYAMDGCPACVAALKDVAELTEQGIDVRTVNTDHDQQAAREAQRFQLHLRPAWRLARADGTEVGRWYGANRAGIIAATIRAKFPTPDEETPVVEEPIETPEEEESIAKEPEPKPELVENLEVVAAPVADFRERAPVVESFDDVGFLDDAKREWNARGQEEETPDERDDDAGGSDDGLSGRGFFGGGGSCPSSPACPSEPIDAALGDRIAERAARSILQGIAPKLDQAKSEAFRKFDKLGADATGALEDRVSAEFMKARRELETKFDKTVSGLKEQFVEEFKKQVFYALLLVAAAFAAVEYAFFEIYMSPRTK